MISDTSLTSNVATFTATGPCYYAIGDRIIISGCGAPYDGERTITGVTSANSGSATFTASITNANIASANPVGALAKPSGKDTFTANFHLVDTSSQFTIPGTWVLLAVKNGATANVEWVTGDVVASASDSDSLQQLTLTSTVDVNGSAGNKPPLRIGAILGTHLRLDGNEIQAMAGDATTGSLILNQSGGNVTVGQGATAQVFINDNGSGGASYINRQSGSNVFIGKSGGSQVVHAYGQLWSDDIATSASAANVFVGSGGRFWQSTSARKNKREIKDLVLTVEQILSLRPVQYKSRTPEDGETVYAGFIADEAEELGLDFWVDHDDEGEVRGFHYGQWTAAQQVVLRAQQDRINDLEERLARIEAHFGDGPV